MTQPTDAQMQTARELMRLAAFCTDTTETFDDFHKRILAALADTEARAVAACIRAVCRWCGEGQVPWPGTTRGYFVHPQPNGDQSYCWAGGIRSSLTPDQRAAVATLLAGEGE